MTIRHALSTGAPPEQGSRARAEISVDLIGLVLLAAAFIWILAVSIPSGADARPQVELLAACSASFGIARIAARASRSLVPAVTVLTGVLMAASSRNDLLSSAPLSGPFRYANAKGAFFMLAALGALMLMASARRPVTKAMGFIAAICFVAVPFASRVLAAAILLIVLPLPVLALSSRNPQATRATVAFVGGAFLLAVIASAVIGATYRGGNSRNTVIQTVEGSLTSNRLALWNDAVRTMLHHPVTGVGPGRFQFFSQTARSDPADLRWAHNEFFQQGAEAGITGLVVMLLLFLWGFWRLYATPSPDGVTALAAVALASIGIQATVDHIFHVPAIPLLAVGLIATGMMGSKRSRDLLSSAP